MRPTSDIHFWHVPKTAGTSVAGLIRKAFAPGESIPAHTVRELVALRREDIPKYRCYTGHFFSLLEPLVGRRLPTVTVLRDPVRQTLSLLGHCQRYVPGAGWIAPLAARSLAFAWEHIPASRSRIEGAWCPVLMNNFQTRVLGSDIRLPAALRRNFYGMTYPFLEPSFCDPAVDLDALYDRAAQRLEAMAVVGTVERLPETIGLISSLLGIASPRSIPEDNVARKRPNVSPHFLDLIVRQNSYDFRLHALATSLLDRRLRDKAAST